NTKQNELMESIAFLNADKHVHALLVQLPLPPHLDEDAAIARMDPKKDVDGFHPENINAFMEGRASVAPGLVMGIVQLITATKEPLAGKAAVIVAKSREFTDTLSHALSAFGITSQVARPDTEDLAQKTQSADIVVTAVGAPGWLTRDMVHEGAILIDVGTTDVNGAITGDVHPSCKEKAGWISPVPGGVGPMTVAMLLKNTAMRAREASHADAE
ncbi:MAG: bifunctional 5,10-methylenetetrahydrofolate dehydrogenase/5,10-methenyltetrahydrofolate cyclohydrolase, partial [Patescibacteria group bacterium]|nr:bifunctional 5,10-methylenetetrahydrofolate dehydrogenase/5,10-methenyltetrahydrofolate cyclohydrolase [Patescibacteria group bacterium]